MCNTILVNNPPTSPPGHIPQQRDHDQLTLYSTTMQSWCEGKCCYEYVGEHLQTSGSLLGSMSIAKLTSIRTVIRITCETNGKLTALTTVQESSGCNMAETYQSLLYWYQGEQSGFDANKTQTKKNIKKKNITALKIYWIQGIQGVRFKPAMSSDTTEATTMSVLSVPNPFCLCGFGTSKSVGLSSLSLSPLITNLWPCS